MGILATKLKDSMPDCKIIVGDRDELGQPIIVMRDEQCGIKIYPRSILHKLGDESITTLVKSLNDTFNTGGCVQTIKAIEFLKSYPYLPVALKRGTGREIFGRPSNSELVRWLNDGAVVINGIKPKPNDFIEYPIKELVFFPNGKRRTTLIKE